MEVRKIDLRDSRPDNADSQDLHTERTHWLLASRACLRFTDNPITKPDHKTLDESLGRIDP
jgi:hypothetical protein